jgi:hypothetical protein
MVRSVTVTTPVISLEELGKRLGLSKARQKALLQIVTGEKAQLKTKRSQTNSKTASVSEAPSIAARTVSGRARHSISPAIGKSARASDGN